MKGCMKRNDGVKYGMKMYNGCDVIKHIIKCIKYKLHITVLHHNYRINLHPIQHENAYGAPVYD